MKKTVALLLCILFVAVFFTACSEACSSAGNCAHSWALTAFVTEQTEVPFAAEFTCEKCKQKKVDSFTYNDIDIPLISLTGDLSAIDEADSVSKDIKVIVGFSYQSKERSFSCVASVKYQGKSTSTYPKKNYSVNLLEADSTTKKGVTFQDSWGAGSKFVLKSNYTDPSAARNIVLSALYGEIAHDPRLTDPYEELVNGGAVDGYPVLLYVNGQYRGLYDWNIRKDAWLFGMGDGTAGEAVVCGTEMDVINGDDGLVIYPEEGRPSKAWEYEYVNENYGEEGWAVESFNEMLFAIRNADSAQVKSVIAEYTELPRLLDVILFNCIFGAEDNITGNHVFCTYDGKKWAPVPYDLDRTLGRSGVSLVEPNADLAEVIECNLLYKIVLEAYFEEICARYTSLRDRILTVENVMSLFEEKLQGVDDRYFAAELQKWQEATWLESENAAEITGLQKELDFIRSFLAGRFAYCDTFFTSEN